MHDLLQSASSAPNTATFSVNSGEAQSRNFKVQSVDADFCRCLGLNAADIFGCELDEIFPAHSAELILAAYDNLSAEAEQKLPDIECVAPNVVIMDVRVRSVSGDRMLEIELLETESTRRALSQAAGSLFAASDPLSPSMVYIAEIRTGLVRAFENNLGALLGLSDQFSLTKYRRITHPDDERRTDEYLKNRMASADHEYSVFEERLHDVSGTWRNITGRSRILERNPDGSVAKTIGLLIETSRDNRVQDALEIATEALAEAEHSERQRVGRELHDSISQLLLGARMSLRVASSLPHTNIPEALQEIDSMIGAVQEEIRGLSFLLHPPELRKRGLSIALEELCHGLRLRLHLPIVFKADPELPRVSDEIEYALYRVAQEALINVHQHACASHVEVLLLMVGRNLELIVSDDGVGIVDFENATPKGVGTASMQARMNWVGGHLEFAENAPGLTLIARAPAFPAGG